MPSCPWKTGYIQFYSLRVVFVRCNIEKVLNNQNNIFTPFFWHPKIPHFFTPKSTHFPPHFLPRFLVGYSLLGTYKNNGRRCRFDCLESLRRQRWNEPTGFIQVFNRKRGELWTVGVVSNERGSVRAQWGEIKGAFYKAANRTKPPKTPTSRVFTGFEK